MKKPTQQMEDFYGIRVAYEVANGATPIYNTRLQVWEFAAVNGTVLITNEYEATDEVNLCFGEWQPWCGDVGECNHIEECKASQGLTIAILDEY